MGRSLVRWFFLHCLLVYPQALYAAAETKPLVLTDIAPIQHLVAPLLAGIATPQPIIGGMQSPHLFQITPSQAERIAAADIIITVGGGLSPELERSIPRLNAAAHRIALLDLPVTGLLPYRQRDAHSGHAEGTDPHIWLDPQLMQAVIRELTTRITPSFPGEQDRIKENSTRVIELLKDTEKRARALLKDVPRRQPVYASYHDAYHYFETRFGLPASTVLQRKPEETAGTRETVDTLAHLAETPPACLFSESKVPLVVRAQESGIRVIALDPEYGLLENPAPDYPSLILAIARTVRECAD